MELSTLLSFQVFAIALLCSPAFATKRAATLDEVLKALGSMYQDKLFSFRNDGDDFETLPRLIIGGEPVLTSPEALETVTVPRYHYCMKTIPYCVTFYGTMIVQDKPLQRSGPQKKNNIRRRDQICLRNIELGPCDDDDHVVDNDRIIDVTNLKISDFCFPGTIELDGQMELLRKLSWNATVHVLMDRPRSYLAEPGSKSEKPSSQVGYFYNACELLDRHELCPTPFDDEDSNPLPCTCEMDPGIYDMDGFHKTVEAVDFFGLGERSGYAVLFDGQGKSCFTFNFTGTETL